ncbi:MAG TPA: carboxypeptidase M32 [Fusobacteriaceae bacterium]|nr:carboxypeptidase M32 [Fusobacteriaceae bacterium]
MKYQKTLDHVINELEKISNYNYASSIIYWDLETEAPKEGIEKASQVLGFYSGESYRILTDLEFNKNIDLLLENIDLLDPINKKIIIETKKDIENIKKIPLNEYKEYNELLSKAQSIWAEAREKNNFSLFLPYLKKIITYKQKYVNYKGYNEHPYDALLDDYEPGITVKQLDIFFDNLKNRLVPLILKINKKKNFISNDILKLDYPIEKQKEFSIFIAKYLGFDFKRGLLRESTHPFSMSLNKYDVRMTTRYFLNDLQSSLFGTIHESGHSIYEQNIGEDICKTRLGGGNSMGIHESQSRLYENLIARSMEFWIPIYPKLQETFPENLKDIPLDLFYKAINKSQSDLIRVEADELTYSLHIILRYEIEKELIEGKIIPEDLPKIWNERMEKYLGTVPDSDSNGVLQDVHWAAGLFGYFPSYALGSANASQIMNSMKNKLNVDDILKEGKLEKIKEYLKENIHKFGKLKDPNEIMEIATKEIPNSKYYVDYLIEKYSKLYEI